MSWRESLHPREPDTVVIVEIAEQFLQAYFGHAPERAAEVLGALFSRLGFDEDFVHHENAWHLATRAHHLHLGAAAGDYAEWRCSQGYLSAPYEAQEYLRERYWNRPR